MRRAFRIPDHRRDVHDEIEFYLEMRAREFMEQGMSADEARAAARAAFGDVAAIEAEVRGLEGERRRTGRRRDWWRGVQMDLLFAVRTLRRNAGFAAAALATLALGIGATVAVFTVVNGVLLRPLPYRDPARLTMVWLVGDDAASRSNELPLSTGFYLDVHDQARAFTRVAAFRSWSYTLGAMDGAGPEQLDGARATPSLFATLGVQPYAGRAFTDDDARAGSGNVAIVSWSLWQRRFGGDRALVGRRVVLSGEPFTIVGIMPPGFAFPRGAELPGGLQFGPRTDLWTPMRFAPDDRANYGTLNLAAVARLAPGTSVDGAQRELHAQLQRFLAEHHSKARIDYHVVGLREQAGTHVRRSLVVLMGAVALVLLIACANVTNLLLARAGVRQRELAVRAALGAGQGRIARQLVTEHGVLALAGAALGLGVAVAISRAMLALVPGTLPRADDVSIDWRVLAVAAAIALVAAGAFALGSVLHVRWSQLAAVLREEGGRTTAGRRAGMGRKALVCGEVALSLMLVIGAALLTRTFVALQRVPPGFQSSGVLTAGILLPIPGAFAPAVDGPRWTRTFDALEARLRARGGVRAVGAVSALPLSGADESGRVIPVGRALPPGEQGPIAQYAVVSGDYFGAMRIPLLAGRAFDASDAAAGANTIVVNRELARRLFGGESPIGRELRTPFDFGLVQRPRTIVGVVGDVKQSSLDAEPVLQVYVPQPQMPYPGLALVVRTDGDPAAAAKLVAEELKALDPTLAAHDVRTMDAVLAESLARQRFSMTLIVGFALAALVLAVVGLYGVVAIGVSQRRREIGVRLALGAKPVDVIRLVLADGMRTTLVGVALGAAGALLLSRVVASLLYGVSATDVATFVLAAAGVLLVALLASWLPARRAAGVDPALTLRGE